jgi:hypothetical protein
MNMRDVAPSARLSRATRKKKEERIDANDAPPILGLFPAVSVQRRCLYRSRQHVGSGKPIAHEFGLSPIALGYLFSSFLWAYVLMMLPGGRLIDRWGPHVVASVATAVWSTAQMATGRSAASRPC